MKFELVALPHVSNRITRWSARFPGGPYTKLEFGIFFYFRHFHKIVHLSPRARAFYLIAFLPTSEPTKRPQKDAICKQTLHLPSAEDAPGISSRNGNGGGGRTEQAGSHLESWNVPFDVPRRFTCHIWQFAHNLRPYFPFHLHPNAFCMCVSVK